MKKTMLAGYELRIPAVKKEIQKEWDKIPAEEKRNYVAQGILSYKVASRYFHPSTETKKYQEIYDFVFGLLTEKKI